MTSTSAWGSSVPSVSTPLHWDELDADLGELAVAAGLGLLVPELRALVPDLPRRGRPVLGVRAAHRSGQFRAQGQVLRRVALVEEVEHLLGDDVGRLTQALEDAEIFEDRRHDLTETGELGLTRESVDQGATTPGLGREDVARALGGFEGRLGHSPRGYRSPSPSLRVIREGWTTPAAVSCARRRGGCGRRRRPTRRRRARTTPSRAGSRRRARTRTASWRPRRRRSRSRRR